MKEVRGERGWPRTETVLSWNGHLYLAKEFELLPACREDSVEDFKGVA